MTSDELQRLSASLQQAAQHSTAQHSMTQDVADSECQGVNNTQETRLHRRQPVPGAESNRTDRRQEASAYITKNPAAANSFLSSLAATYIRGVSAAPFLRRRGSRPLTPSQGSTVSGLLLLLLLLVGCGWERAMRRTC